MNIIFQATRIDKFCRVCFQSTTELVPCNTKLFIKNSSYTVREILNLISRNPGGNDPPDYPTGICSACQNLIHSTLVLKTKYEETNHSLKTLFADLEKKQAAQTEVIQNSDNDDVPNLHHKEDFNDESQDILHDDEKISIITTEGGALINGLKIFKTIEKKELPKQLKKPEKISQAKVVNRETLNNGKIRISKKLTSKLLVNQNHVCPICKTELPTPFALRQHAYMHRILKKYLSRGQKIPTRSKFFAKPRDTHTIFNKDDILHKCMFCKDEIRAENFPNHVANHTTQGEFQCRQCDRVFRKLNHLNIHVTSTHLKELPYQCDKCDKGFTIKYNYDCHLLTHMVAPNELPHKCGHCDKKFANKVLLQRHSFSHTDRSFWSLYKINKCQTCLRTFESSQALQEHKKSKCVAVKKTLPPSKRVPRKYLRKPDILNGWMCDLCPKTFNRSGTLWAHKYTTHGKPKKRVSCALCGAKVVYLKQHMKSHQPKDDPVECYICHKKLASKLTLIKHIRTHTGERPYACKFCAKRFKDIHSKCVHERIHEGVKKHICGVCGKGFLEKAYMLKHMRGVHK